VLAAIGAAGVLIRRFFVLRQSGRLAPALPAVAALLLVGLAVILAPARGPSGPSGAAMDDGASFARVQGIVRERCASCHAERPTQPGFVQPPAGVLLDTPERIRAAAARIHQSVVVTKTMPLANLTGITESERAALAAWVRSGVRVE
jgi:uncharacterized membrane protein